jgi:hypothetical protein
MTDADEPIAAACLTSRFLEKALNSRALDSISVWNEAWIAEVTTGHDQPLIDPGRLT